MKVGISGYGRFGRLLADLLKDEFDLVIYDVKHQNIRLAEKNGYLSGGLDEVAKCRYIFLAVPIAYLESSIEEMNKQIGSVNTVIDVSSVKSYPVDLMKKHLRNSNYIATHPLFGPDSVKNGLSGLKMAICGGSDDKEVEFWAGFWRNKGVEVIHTTPNQHDRDMIYSLGFTQTMARLAGLMDLPQMKLTTKNFDAVNEVIQLSLSDTDQLYHDMLYYNPYFKEMKLKFTAASEKMIEFLDEI